MIYKEFKPHILLAPYIETYWTADRCKGEEECHRVLPDGCIDIIISFHASAHFELTPCRPYVVGTMTTFYKGSYPEKIHLFGIRFRPAGFTAFCKVPVHEFTDQKIELTLVDSLFDKRFYDSLSEKQTIAGMIRQVDSYLIHKLRELFIVDPRIVFAVNRIRQLNGLLVPGDVAANCCLSLRQFERKFKNAVGISPKMFSRITKFQHACDYLESTGYTGLFTAAVDCGYYDQAHLIKDFKSLSGEVPSKYKR